MDKLILGGDFVDSVNKKRIVGNSTKATSSDLKDLLINQVSTQIKQKRIIKGLP